MNKLIAVPMRNGELSLPDDKHMFREDVALLIPKILGKPYRKGMGEVIVNSFKEMSDSLSLTVENFDTTEDDISHNMVLQFKQLAQLMQFMVNSRSWEDGEYYDFDVSEIRKRLEQIAEIGDV